MKEIYSADYKCPFGTINLLFDEADTIYSLSFGAGPDTRNVKKIKDNLGEISIKSAPLLAAIKQSLDAYFAGDINAFNNMDLRPFGTEFQLVAWQALQTIPFGQTASYGDQAKKIGNPKAVRAVGGANNKNPIAIIIPCHRVIGANGKMVGFGGGISTKEWLLAHERAKAV